MFRDLVTPGLRGDAPQPPPHSSPCWAWHGASPPWCLLLAYGTGFERGQWAAFRSFGTNLVFVFPGRTSQQAGGNKAGTRSSPHHERCRPHP